MKGVKVMYYVYIDGEFYERTEENKLQLNDLERGKSYEVEVLNIRTAEREVFTVCLDDIETIDTDELDKYKKKAGWYEFEDGHKVRGADAAKEYYQSLHDSPYID